ncbi:hypothetical protein [Spirosoma aerolatum]|uniref:hypothetical protein n=1 Tax=Spirosoma aerolatum TaxID=1211326 RepID=UPI0015CFB84B|nr:hypothetical protein [Spirosoma aerolatum]
MKTKTNVSLLKEYIKTLVATEVEFPGVLPRGWGNEFTRTELSAIYFTLKFVLKSAEPKTRLILMDAFKNVNHPGMNMHWFLCDFWSEIVPLLTKQNASEVHYPSSKRAKTPQGLDLALLNLMKETVNQ